MLRARNAVLPLLAAVVSLGAAAVPPVPAEPTAPKIESERKRGESPADSRVDPRAKQQQEDWRKRFGTQVYRYLEDPKHGLVFATCLDETSHAQMQVMLEKQADQQSATLFDSPPEAPVFVAIAKPADAKAVIGGSQTTEGMYEHPFRRLVASDIGMVLRHEFTHLMHFGHMERLGQPHMIWVQEGIAALYENYDLAEDGSITFTPNLRHNQVRQQASTRTFTPFSKLVGMKQDDFMANSQRLYPQVRSIFEFMADSGKLRKWYRRYTETFNDDRTGVKALEEVFGLTLVQIENEWRTWVLKRPAIAVTAVADIRDMGIEVNGVTDGVQVRTVQRRGAATRSGLKVGDVITAVDGTAVRSPREFLAAVGAAKNDRVVLTVRRVKTTFEMEVRFSVANPPARTSVTKFVVPACESWPVAGRDSLLSGQTETHS